MTIKNPRRTLIVLTSNFRSKGEVQEECWNYVMSTLFRPVNTQRPRKTWVPVNPIGRKQRNAAKVPQQHRVSFVQAIPPRDALCRVASHNAEVSGVSCGGRARSRHRDGSIQHQGVVLWGWLVRNTRGLAVIPWKQREREGEGREGGWEEGTGMREEMYVRTLRFNLAEAELAPAASHSSILVPRCWRLFLFVRVR